MRPDYRSRVEALKSVEAFCYTLCVHLLTEERLATAAAKLALIDLFQDDSFLQAQGEERLIRVRKKTVARALELLSDPSRRVAAEA